MPVLFRLLFLLVSSAGASPACHALCRAMGDSVLVSSLESGGESACRALCSQQPLCRQYTSFKDPQSLRHLCTLYSNGTMSSQNPALCTSSCSHTGSNLTEPTGITRDWAEIWSSSNNGTSLTDETGLLVVGGLTMELWMPHTVGRWGRGPQPLRCSLPRLQDGLTGGHTVDFVQGKIIICGRLGCLEVTPTGPRRLARMQRQRSHHTSHPVSYGLLLIGGEDPGNIAKVTSEFVPADGSQSESQWTFPLAEPGRSGACSVMVTLTTVVIVGGAGNSSLVTEVTGVMPGEDHCTRRLPDTLTPRYNSACGLYIKDGNQMLIVTGGELDVAGQYKNTALTSTEVYDYTLGSPGWREAGPLPKGRWSLRGASLAGVLHVLGGYKFDKYGYTAEASNEVSAWDPATETWSRVGRLADSRAGLAVTQVPLSAVAQYCTPRD